MADLVLAYDILNETQADAVPVQSNYERIEAHVNSNVIRTDGATVMVAPLQLFGDPVSANDAVRKGFLDMLMPVGVILPFGGSAVPGGLWALANGADMSTTVYPALYNAIGYNFGGAGSTFKLPDLRGRTMIGQSATAPFTTLNAPAGNKDVTAMPRHQHTTPNHAHTTADHTHGVAINTGTESATHVHGPESGAGHQFAVVAGSILYGTAVEGGGATIFKLSGSPTGNALTTGQSVNHYHGVNGNTGGRSDGAANTGGAAPTTDFAGAVGAEVNANLPPYIVINFIVRVS